MKIRVNVLAVLQSLAPWSRLPKRLRGEADRKAADALVALNRALDDLQSICNGDPDPRGRAYHAIGVIYGTREIEIEGSSYE